MFDKTAAHKIKMIVLGDTGVGKTTLVARFCGRDLPKFAPTIGCNFNSVKVPAGSLNDLPVGMITPDFALNIWDTAGQERYHSILDLYFQDVDVCLLVYDVNDNTSLIRLFEVWLPRYFKSKYNNTLHYERTLFYLVGNKDDKDEINPKTSEHLRTTLHLYKDSIKKYQIKIWTVSALRNQYIDDLLSNIKSTVVRHVLPHKNEARALKSDLVSLVGQVNDETNTHNFNAWKTWITSACTVL